MFSRNNTYDNLTNPNVVQLLARLTALGSLDYNPKAATKQDTKRWEYERDTILNQGSHPLNLPRMQYVKEVSVPQVLTVLQNNTTQSIVMVVHGPYNIHCQKALLNPGSLKVAIDQLCDELLPKKRMDLIKHAKSFEFIVNLIEGVFENRDRLYPGYTYTFLGYSFGATMLYYAILRSNSLAQRLHVAHMFNPIVRPLLLLTFRRKMHPGVLAKVFIHKYNIDKLSDGVMQLQGNKLIYSDHWSRRMHKHVKAAPKWNEYYHRLRSQTRLDMVNTHSLSHFY